MHAGRCDCCGKGAEGRSLGVLEAAGWSLVEHVPGEGPVLLCSVCSWQRREAADIVASAVQAAYGMEEAPSHDGQSKTRRGWFWS